eukprot:gene4247-5230_t
MSAPEGLHNLGAPEDDPTDAAARTGSIDGAAASKASGLPLSNLVNGRSRQDGGSFTKSLSVEAMTSGQRSAEDEGGSAPSAKSAESDGSMPEVCTVAAGVNDSVPSQPNLVLSSDAREPLHDEQHLAFDGYGEREEGGYGPGLPSPATFAKKNFWESRPGSRAGKRSTLTPKPSANDIANAEARLSHSRASRDSRTSEVASPAPKTSPQPAEGSLTERRSKLKLNINARPSALLVPKLEEFPEIVMLGDVGKLGEDSISGGSAPPAPAASNGSEQGVAADPARSEVELVTPAEASLAIVPAERPAAANVTGGGLAQRGSGAGRGAVGAAPETGSVSAQDHAAAAAVAAAEMADAVAAGDDTAAAAAAERAITAATAATASVGAYPGGGSGSPQVPQEEEESIPEQTQQAREELNKENSGGFFTRMGAKIKARVQSARGGTKGPQDPCEEEAESDTSAREREAQQEQHDMKLLMAQARRQAAVPKTWHDEALKLETRVNSSATTPSGRTSAEPRPVAYKFDFDGNSAGFTEKAAVPVPGHAVAARSQVGVAQQAGMGQALGAEAGGTRAAPSRERVASKEARTKLKREIWHDLTLGVVVDNGVHASREDLQRAYRKAAIKFHPDRHQDAVLRVQVYHECALKLVQEKMN